MNSDKKIILAVSRDSLLDPLDREDNDSGSRWFSGMSKALGKLGAEVEPFLVERDDLETPDKLEIIIKDLNPVCIFNQFEGFEDAPHLEAEFVRLLERAEILYTGNPSSALEVCLDKNKVKQLLSENGIPVPEGSFLTDQSNIEAKDFNYPLFIKPCFEDASIGISNDSLVAGPRQFIKTAGSKLKEFPEGLIAEEFLPGREYNVGLMGEYPYELIGISVLEYPDTFLDYNAKWDDNSPEYSLLLPDPEIEIADSIREKLRSISSGAGVALGCRNYFRVDIREKNGKFFVIDVNPNPDISPDSGFARQAAYRGYTSPETIRKIIDLTLA